MSVFDLEKRAQSVRFVLEKRAVKTPPVMRVGAALDISGSARGLYQSGVIQETLNRLVPIALKFDDNGELDVWAFDSAYQQLETVDKFNYEDYVQKEILNNQRLSKWGGTKYAGPLQSMGEFYFPHKSVTKSASGLLGSLFGKKPAAPSAPAAALAPAMGLFITDGANDDRAAAAAVLRNSKDVPVYWQMVGVGNPQDFGFLQEMADELVFKSVNY